MSQLVLINTKNINIERIFFYQLAAKNNWKIINEQPNLIVLQTNGWFLHERQVSILMSQGAVYVNVMSSGKYDIKTPLYIKKDKQIINEITQYINNTQT
jgi:hypothetical protein